MFLIEKSNWKGFIERISFKNPSFKRSSLKKNWKVFFKKDLWKIYAKSSMEGRSLEGLLWGEDP